VIPPPPSQPALTARYVLDATWDQGFVANVDVFDHTGSDQSFEVRLTYSNDVAIVVVGYWNATPTAAGNSLLFTGGPVVGGGTMRFGFQADKNRTTQVDPIACTINGQPCEGF